MTLNEFIQDIQRDVVNFDRDWRDNNAKTPTEYPLSFPNDDAGSWWEQFVAFRDSQ